MKEIVAYIDSRTAELADNPFIQWLSDDSVSAEQRLSAWLPCAAFFVFGFMDLNGFVLRYPESEAEGDLLKKAINHHLAEDCNHWPWYLSDLRKLGLDSTMTFSEALQLLWGKETLAQRRAVYQLCMLAAGAEDPIVRYSLLAALESYAHLLFSTLIGVSETYRTETGTKLLYLGPVHFEREPGHLANQHDDTEDLVRHCEIDAATRARAMRIAGQVCDLIDSRWREFFHFAQSRRHAEFLIAN